MIRGGKEKHPFYLQPGSTGAFSKTSNGSDNGVSKGGKIKVKESPSASKGVTEQHVSVQNDNLPLAIQIFLWRQTSPFIRPKFSKMHEATCMEIKEACKIFEKVLIQNIRFGLSPSFTDALTLISRWKFIVATLPHVIQCSAALLQHRKESSFNLGSSETKLLYTLHWILLDAADECSLDEYEKAGKIDTSPFAYLFPLSSITTFIYLFAPICSNVRESDFMQNFRLENGKKIWKALWDFNQPDVPCFSAKVKPRKPSLRDLKKTRSKNKGANQQGMFKEDEGGESPAQNTRRKPTQHIKGKWLKLTRKGLIISAMNHVADKKSETPKTDNGENPSADKPVRKSLLSTPFANPLPSPPPPSRSTSSIASSKEAPNSNSSSIANPSKLKDSKGGNNPLGNKVRKKEDDESALASYFDIAVLRCLYISYWSEEGVYWALTFFQKKLRGLTYGMYNGKLNGEPSTNGSDPSNPRKRSNSLPIPQIEVTFAKDSNSQKTNEIESSELENGNMSTIQSNHNRTTSLSEKTIKGSRIRKKSLISGLEVGKLKCFKSFVESKILSKSDRALDAESSHNVLSALPSKKEMYRRRSSGASICDFATRALALERSRSKSTVGCTYGLEGKPGISKAPPLEKHTLLSSNNSRLVKGKSMPSLSYLIDELKENGYYGLRKVSTPNSLHKTEKYQKRMMSKPIITVTEFTPITTPDKISTESTTTVDSPPLGPQPLSTSLITNTENQPTPLVNMSGSNGNRANSEMCSFGEAIPPQVGVAAAVVNAAVNHSSALVPRVNTTALGYVLNAAGPSEPSQPAHLFRSRTDSKIDYVVNGQMEAPGSTFYINKFGEIDYVILLKALHKISLREYICTSRVCEALLSLLSSLIDVGLLTNKSNENPSFSTSNNANNQSKKSQPKKTKEDIPVSTPNDKSLSIHNIFMDITVRILKVLGCINGCHDCSRMHVLGSESLDNLRSQVSSMISRLLWLNKKEFKKYFAVLLKTEKDVPFVTCFLHAYLNTCIESAAISPAPKPMGGARKRSSKINQEMNLAYANNFGENAENAPKPIMASAESIILSSLFKKIITCSVSKTLSLRAPENVVIYTDIRNLVNYVRVSHGSIFRRVILSAMLDSIQKLERKQQKIESPHITRYPNIESTDFTGGFCCIEDETEKLVYKKSVFKKKSSSSTATSIIEGTDSPLTRGSPAGSLTKKYCVLSRSHDNNDSKKQSRFQMAFNWLTGKAGTDYYEDGSSFPHTTPSPGGGLQPSGGSFVVNNMCDGNFGSEDFGISSKAGEFIPSTLPPSRKVSVHSRSQQRLNKNANSKTMLRMAKRTFTEKIGINRSRKKETELEDPYYEISRCNSYDFETGTKDSVSVYFRERLHVPIDSIQIGLDRFSFLLETSNPGTVPDSLLIAALLDLPKAPIITRACYLLECAYFVQQCNKGQWPIWLKNNVANANPLFQKTGRGYSLSANNPGPNSQPLQKRTVSLQLQAAKMFHQWAEMLGSRIDELLTVESNQTLNNVSNSNDETRQRQLLLEDDEEDFLDEASVNPNSQSTNCPTVLKLVACVLLLEITAFMRETYKILPKTHLTKTSGATPNVINIPSKPTGGSIVASGIGGSISATSAGRRWSMATQSLNIGNLSMDSPSGMMTTSATSTSNMTGGGATTPGSTQDHRKISFVIQNEDNDSANSSQTTLTVQGDSLDTTGTDKRSTGPRIVQGKPKIVKPGGSFKRRSIRLKKGSGGECNSERSSLRKKNTDTDTELKSPSTNTSAVLKMDGSGGSLGPGAPDVRNPSTSVGSTGSGGASKPASAKKPLPNARSRWKMLTGTTIFINRLALKRADSATAAAKRKVSAISVSDVSDFETGEDSPGPEESFKDSDTHLYEVFEDSDVVNLDQNMPWLNVVSKLINSLNYYCTHQTFCYSNCYRRQMRAAKRIMEAASTIYGYETEFTEEFANGMNQQHGLGETTDAQQDFHRRKMSRKGKGPKTDSNSTSPDRKKDNNLVVSLDPEKGGLPDILGNDPPLQTSITAPHSLGSLNNGEKQSQGDKIPGNYSSGLGTVEKEDINVQYHKTNHPSTEKNQHSPKKPEKKKNEEPKPILKYLQQRVRSLFHIPLYVINKSSCILSESIFLELLPVTWELLLEADKDVVGAAASLFIVSSVKIPTQCLDLISSELNHQLPDQRISAIQRFQVLWQNRQQVWQRLEENGQISMKVTPSQIEFTLPSPKLGVESLPVIDPCWIPRYKTKIEDVTIQHDKSQMLLSATKSRKKQQSELIQSVIYAEEEKRRKERENFHITSVPVTMRAAYEPSLYNGGNVDEHDEGDEDNNETDKTTPKSSYQIAQTLFPSTLCSAFMEIITLLEDQAVSLDGIAVYEVAYQLIWSCLVEDSNLFLKYFMEKLTRDHIEEVFRVIRVLIRFLPKLPQQAAFSLYNYIIGYIMFYVRHPRDKAQELIGQALATLWMVVHSVQGIMFKDLKQILRKEQVDAAILLTANVPAAKKIVVHGPQGPDEGGIPSQFPLGEDVQFCQILQEAQDFFGIDDEVSKEYFLVDHKTKTIHNPQHHARDYYFFKRTQYPQLSLVHKEPATAYDELQKQCYSNKFVEIGKVMLIWGVLKNVSQVVQRVVFLHEDLMKLPSFPRKALESELDLHTNGKMGKELHGLDVLHKFNWIRLIARMFEAMSGNFAYPADVHLFINVICGALALHAEDSCILRYCFATIINAAHQFKNIFSNSGYFLVMPSLLRIYSNNQTNRLITTTIEFVCKQLYVLHRKPFLLQMFGSIAPILDRDDDTAYGDAFKIQPKCLYKLLSSLSYRTADNLNIMELVRLKKPLTALDFCYSGEPENISVIECISLCVLVVAYDSSTKRARQMLRILEAIMPYFLRDLVSDKKMDTKTVRDMIHQLTVTMKVLLNNCDELTKNYSGPTNQGGVDDRKTRLHSSRGGPYSPVIEIDEDSHSRYIGAMGDSSRTARGVGNNTDDLLDSEWKRDSYCSPRNSILLLTGEFIIMCSTKLSEINKKTSSEKQLELMDNKCYMKLVDIAHSLLKMAPYDLDVMKLGGLQKYMNEIFPITDWSVESMRPSLLTILRRLDKLFTKIHKSPKVYHVVDWTAAAGLLHGVYTTVWKYPYIVNLTNLKSLIATCQCLIVGEDSLSGLTDIHAGRSNNIRRNELPPKEFCSVIFQLIALQVLVLGDTYTLEQRLQLSDNNQIALYSLLTHDKGESLLLNLLLPLCLNVGCGRKDVPKLRKSDVKFALNLLLTLLNPKSANRKDHNQHELLTISTSHNTIGAGSYNDGIASSGGACSGLYNTATDVRSKNKHSSLEIGFLGLKIIITCFDYQLNDEWFRIARIIREMGNRQEGNGPLWRFLDFISTQRSPLYTLLLPFIHNRAQLFADSEPERHFHLERARERITVSSGSKSKSLVLDEFGKELEELRDNLNKRIQESFLDLSNGSRRHTGRGSSQRNSFIEYVSEVYNRGTAGYNSSNDKCGNLPMESLSARGHSISSGGSGVSANSFSATLRRNLSIRSENLPQSNKVLGLQRNTKSSRSTGVYRTMVTEKIPRRTSYSGEQTLDPHGSHLQPKNATSEPRLYRKSTIFSRHRHIKSRHGRSRQSVLSDPGGNDSNISNNPSTSSSSGGGIILQPNNGVDSVNNLRPKSPVPGRGKLQRQKAQSRKTFKLHKTRKEIKEARTMMKNLSSIEIPETGGVSNDLQQLSVRTIPNQSLSTVDSVIKRISPTCKTGKYPFATDVAVHICSSSKSPPKDSKVIDMEGITLVDAGDDSMSISSRGTSSTIGYRDSFGEMEEGNLLSIQERGHEFHFPSCSITEQSNAMNNSSSHEVMPMALKRKNYIIFEQNDEDTLI
uniref:Uncharacterized protein n=1 Tax=Lepeophtheirus salmonis TaxID=72036 RepID=A0A0K2T575_LEPSM